VYICLPLNVTDWRQLSCHHVISEAAVTPAVVMKKMSIVIVESEQKMRELCGHAAVIHWITKQTSWQTQRGSFCMTFRIPGSASLSKWVFHCRESPVEGFVTIMLIWTIRTLRKPITNKFLAGWAWTQSMKIREWCNTENFPTFYHMSFIEWISM
jgi:hypothetical protein